VNRISEEAPKRDPNYAASRARRAVWAISVRRVAAEGLPFYLQGLLRQALKYPQD